MRLQNQTRTGNICNQNIAWEWLHFGDRFREAHFGMIYVFLLVALRGIWQVASAGVRGRQFAIGNVLTLQFLPCTLSHPSCTGLVRTPSPSISTAKISPGCMKTGGLRAAPTPPGVPVMITSPRSRLIATLIISIS